MKAHSKGFFGGLAVTVALVITAFAQPDSSAYLNNYTTAGTQIRAGFTPRETNLVLGQPLEAIFTVKNLGPTNFAFTFGGDYRSTGRHDSFKITAKNSVGVEMPDPVIRRPAREGGIFTQDTFEPGRAFTNIIDLTKFRVIDKPGVYSFNCSYGFGNYDLVHRRQSGLIVQSSFVLTILQHSPENVARVINELLAKAEKSHGHDLNETLNKIAAFGKDEAVPYLARVSKTGSTELRTGAIAALSSIPTEDSLDAVLTAFKDDDPAIRTAAASSLGAMQKPRAVEALLQRFPGEKSPVDEAIIRALGTSKSERGFRVITNSLDSGETNLQRAAVEALASYGGSNAVDVLRRHINTNYLAVRYDITLALAEKLHQPIQAEWLLPVLMKREQDSDWLDSQRVLQLYGGTNAIPTLLSAVDFDAPWSQRNWWILFAVQYCPGAPHFEYDHDPNSDGTPEQWEKNRRTLQALKPLAGPIPPSPAPGPPPPIKYLKTDPPVDFVPTFREVEGGGVEIKSGFLTLTLWRGGANEPYSVSDQYRAIYTTASRFLALVNASSETRAKLKLTPEQTTRLATLSRQFAVKLCGSRVSDQKIGNFYSLLVNNSEYCPSDDTWWECFRDYKEAPPSLKEQTKTDLINSVVIFSENYHEGTVEFAQAARKIFTGSQIEEILR